MDIRQKLAAIIIAGGFSTRAPGFKPLLVLNESTLIEIAVELFREAGIGEILVVLGHRADEVKPVVNRLGVKSVVNENYHSGMFSSITAGIKALGTNVRAAFLLPVDMPLVRSYTVLQLADAFEQNKGEIIYPVFNGKRGHPPLIGASLFSAVKCWNKPEGMHSLLANYEGRSYDLNVFDEGINIDIDTADDYQAVVNRGWRRDIPTMSEAEAVLAGLGISQVIVKHCRLVALIAQRLAAALNNAGNGVRLDESLIAAAALLHDVAKGKPDHAYSGAKLLESLGYPKVAKIVAGHMDIDAGAAPLDETAVVYLADKLVREGKIVAVGERFENSLKKVAQNKEVYEVILRRKKGAEVIAKKIELLVGASIGEICGEQFL